MVQVVPEELSRWHHRIATLSGEETRGYLLLEAVTCYGHGPEPVAELEWTARLETANGDPAYEHDIRLDWAEALEELAGGSCPWLDEPCRLTWLTPGDSTRRLRYDLFD